MRSLLALLLLVPLPCLGADAQRLVILEETGQVREGVPVLRIHPEHPRIAAQLSRGFPGHMLRLYGWEQVYLQKQGGTAPEPAYLLLSNNQGGYPRYGFFLGSQDKRQAAYVDLHRRSAITGAWGGADQIFPHELGHVLLKQLGPLNLEGGANQVHAIGVRTDPQTALDEGFGEHFQIMALDDPEAAPETQALLADSQAHAKALAHLEGYRRECLARFAPFARQRMTTLLWFSRMEDVVRYYEVKRNAFAREAEIPDELLSRDIYAAYLLENVLPGAPGGKPKSAARLLASEGVIAALFHRWATSPRLQSSYRDESFYAQFGATRAEVAPVENWFLKLFYALHRRKPQDAAQVAGAYKETFPDEADGIDAALQDVFLGQALPTAGAIWLANKDFKTGTTLFDQFRGAPRTHTFDLNGASLVDLMSVPGMTLDLAAAIRRAAPFQKLEGLSRIPGLPAGLLARFRSMQAEMQQMSSSEGSAEETLSIKTILYPYAWRMGWAWLAAGLAGAVLYRLLRVAAWWRCGLDGLGAALPALLLGWIKGGLLLPLFAPVLIFGVAGALWRIRRDRRLGPGLRVLAAWLAAAVPGVILTRPWF